MKIQVRCMLDSFFVLDEDKHEREIRELKKLGLTFESHLQNKKLLKQKPGYAKIPLCKTVTNLLDIFGDVSLHKDKNGIILKYSIKEIYK
ncbi:hypothetical protein KAR91_32615 [Candidatus Pacearchaeota archaeon]|nr:hypothetical protein [Candidatus Pacearchaeota archaeon]